jgi:ElaB/YqjD/DUF883 family membrane-anchored ribosome-binding protein
MATRDTTGSMGPTLGTGTGASTSNMSGQAEELRRDAADQGGRLVDKARSSVRSAFEHQQNRTADSIGSVAQALHRAADELNQQNQGVVARYTDTAADRIERFADSLRHRDVDDLVADVEGFARRQPELFIGGAVALGFLFSRFLRRRATVISAARARRVTADIRRVAPVMAEAATRIGFTGSIPNARIPVTEPLTP